jgi:hypothetical protein
MNIAGFGVTRIPEGVEEALDELARVAYTVEGIVLKHA